MRILLLIVSAVWACGLTLAAAPEQSANAIDHTINLDAKPVAFSFDPTKTAVIVVDMQNDFGAKGGMLDRAGLDVSGIQKAVAPTAKVLAADQLLAAGPAPDQEARPAREADRAEGRVLEAELPAEMKFGSRSNRRLKGNQGVSEFIGFPKTQGNR